MLYKIRTGMAGAVFPEEFIYITIGNLDDFISLVKNNSKFPTPRIYWDDIENILCLEYEE